MTHVAQIMETPPTLTDWQVSLAGLVMGPGTPYDLVSLTGTDELPPLDTSDEQRSWAHGVWEGDDWSDGRTLGWEIEIMAEGAVTLEAALAAYRSRMVPTVRGELVSLWVKVPDSPLRRWPVKVRRHRIADDQKFDLGVAAGEAQVFAPDPLGYGPGLSASTGFPAPGPGLAYNLFTDGSTHLGYLYFGAAGATGRIAMSNGGTADVSPVYVIGGPTPVGGFEIVDVPTGRRIRYTGEIPTGSSVEIDTGTGDVILDGAADRSTLVTVREWTPIPAEGSTTVAFVPLGPTSAGTLTAYWAPAWW